MAAELHANPFLSSEDPTERLVALLAPEGAVHPADTFEEIIDQLLEDDPNASGFMRAPVRAVFVNYDESQWERTREVGFPDQENKVLKHCTVISCNIAYTRD